MQCRKITGKGRNNTNKDIRDKYLEFCGGRDCFIVGVIGKNGMMVANICRSLLYATWCSATYFYYLTQSLNQPQISVSSFHSEQMEAGDVQSDKPWK